jgi:hypothetical protein
VGEDTQEGDLFLEEIPALKPPVSVKQSEPTPAKIPKRPAA